MHKAEMDIPGDTFSAVVHAGTGRNAWSCEKRRRVLRLPTGCQGRLLALKRRANQFFFLAWSQCVGYVEYRRTPQHDEEGIQDTKARETDLFRIERYIFL